MTPQFIIIHHSATKDSGTVSWQAIRRFHIDECVWGDIGYHFGIEMVLDVPWAKPHAEIMFGRMPFENGAHTTGMKQKALGICCVGNFDAEDPPPEVWEACLKLVRWLMGVYGITEENVRGHRDFAHKTCPGSKWDMDKFRSEL